MINVVEIDEPIKVGSGQQVRAKMKGTLPMTVVQVDGRSLDIALQDYKCVPDIHVNLFSLTKAMSTGWRISNTDKQIKLSKNGVEIVFDRYHRTADGFLCGIDMYPVSSGERALTASAVKQEESTNGQRTKKPVYWDINDLHKVFGHASENALRRSAKNYGWRITGTFHPCEFCAAANAKQTKVPHSTESRSEIPGERIFMDISSANECEDLQGNGYWLGIVDDATNMHWSRILKSKKELNWRLRIFIKELARLGAPVKYIRCDDAGENIKLKEECEIAVEPELRAVTFEITGRDTPQRNGKIERWFAVATARIRATFACAQIPKEWYKKLWGEVIPHITDIENALQSVSTTEPSHRMFYGTDVPRLDQLRTFGEIGYVKFVGQFKGKLQDRGLPMMYLGRARNHSADTYRMWNLATFQVVITRDVIWMHKTYGEWKKLGLPSTPDQLTLLSRDKQLANARPEDEVNKEMRTQRRMARSPQYAISITKKRAMKHYPQNQPTHNEVPEIQPTESTESTRSDKVTKELQRLNASFNPVAKLANYQIPRDEPLTTRLRSRAPTPHTMKPTPGGPTHTNVTTTSTSEGGDRGLAAEEPVSLPDQSVVLADPATDPIPRVPDTANLTIPAITLVDKFGGDIEAMYEWAEAGFAVIEADQTGGLGQAGLKQEKLDYDPTKVDPAKYKYLFEKPVKFNDAWNHPEPFQREQWRKGIQKELEKMKELKVWRKIKKSEMEPGRRCVKHKWVFEIKRSGIFRARLVACGYSQVPGVDFEQIYSPVANDISFRIVLIVLLKMSYDAIIFDVETAFLHGKLDVKIYMDCPDGLEHEEDECVLLDQTIYGLVQSARAYYSRIAGVLVNKMEFEPCPCDPCLFMRKRHGRVVIVLVYVDDNLCIGVKEDLLEVTKEVEKHGFKITVEQELTDYLSCEIRKNSRGDMAWLGQPHMIKKIENAFGEEVTRLPKYKTPGTPGYTIVKTENEDEMIEEEKQSRYRTGVGMLMYLIKHSRPDIANAVRELAKCLGKATKAAYREMTRCIKYVLDTKSKGLLMAPKKNQGSWEIEVFSDSDWAGDKNDRKSVTSTMIFVEGVIIFWRSRSQKVVSLSSSEAEFYACGEAVREVPFVAQIISFLGFDVKLPVQVRIDNVGAIFMSENVTSSSRTRHMDTRWHFVNNMQDEGLIKIDFVRSEENVSDIGTKNVTTEIHETHTKKLLGERGNF